MKQVLVFKTSVHSSRDVSIVEPLLHKLLDKTERWTFDLEDCDKVLRVEAEFVAADSIIEKFKSAGVMCAELE
ncbi:MAG: hypothetical protein V4721_17950 [Bacteroidota bacterium]